MTFTKPQRKIIDQIIRCILLAIKHGYEEFKDIIEITLPYEPLVGQILPLQVKVAQNLYYTCKEKSGKKMRYEIDTTPVQGDPKLLIKKRAGELL